MNPKLHITAPEPDKVVIVQEQGKRVEQTHYVGAGPREWTNMQGEVIEMTPTWQSPDKSALHIRGRRLKDDRIIFSTFSRVGDELVVVRAPRARPLCPRLSPADACSNTKPRTSSASASSSDSSRATHRHACLPPPRASHACSLNACSRAVVIPARRLRCLGWARAQRACSRAAQRHRRHRTTAPCFPRCGHPPPHHEAGSAAGRGRTSHRLHPRAAQRCRCAPRRAPLQPTVFVRRVCEGQRLRVVRVHCHLHAGRRLGAQGCHLPVFPLERGLLLRSVCHRCPARPLPHAPHSLQTPRVGTTSTATAACATLAAEPASFPMAGSLALRATCLALLPPPSATPGCTRALPRCASRLPRPLRVAPAHTRPCSEPHRAPPVRGRV